MQRTNGRRSINEMKRNEVKKWIQNATDLDESNAFLCSSGCKSNSHVDAENDDDEGTRA